MTESNTALIALGANLGKPEATFRRALERLAGESVDVVAVSGLWRSPAWPEGSGAPDYLNAVAKVRTGLRAEALLALLHELEAEAGRRRSMRNAPRELDLDLLDHGGRVVEGELVLPHPRLQSRAFVLLPLWEVEPEWVHPVSGEGLWEMMGKLGSEGVMATMRITGLQDYNATNTQLRQPRA